MLNERLSDEGPQHFQRIRVAFEQVKTLLMTCPQDGSQSAGATGFGGIDRSVRMKASGRWIYSS
jgi:hypothetical protein